MLCFGNKALRTQQNAIATGTILMLSSGIQIGYGNFNWMHSEAAWSSNISQRYLNVAIASWYFGSILGFALSPVLQNFMNKKIIYLIADVTVGTSAVFMIAFPKYYETVISTRLFSGIGHGLAYVVLIQHFGQIADKNVRGKIGTSIYLFILKGGIISGDLVIEVFTSEDRMDVNRFFGIIILSFSVLATILAIVSYKESPVDLILKGKQEKAFKALVLIRNEQDEADELQKEFKDLEEMVKEDQEAGYGVFVKENIAPLVIVILLRLAFVLISNYGLKIIHIMMEPEFNGFDYTFILNVGHTISVIIVIFTIDFGRRFHYFLSSFTTSIILIVLGPLAAVFIDSNILKFFFFTGFEIFSAIGIGMMCHIYSTEAFRTLRMAKSIAFTASIENFVQVLFMILMGKIIYSTLFEVIFFITSGIILAIISLFLFSNIPETKKLTMREARNEFLSPLNFKIYKKHFGIKAKLEINGEQNKMLNR